YMTWDQVRELEAAGWGIASHSLTHRALHSMAWSDSTNEVLKSKAYIEQNITGTVVRFVCPRSDWNGSLNNYALSVGYILVPYNTPRDALYTTGGKPVTETYITNAISRNTQGTGYYME